MSDAALERLARRRNQGDFITLKRKTLMDILDRIKAAETKVAADAQAMADKDAVIKQLQDAAATTVPKAAIAPLLDSILGPEQVPTG